MSQDFFYPPGSSNTVVIPPGGATAANQTTQIGLETSTNSAVVSIDGKTPTVGQKTMAQSSPVVIASDQSAVAVSGPLTDTQLRASAVPVSLASVPLPSGAATEATLAAFSAKTAGALVPAAFDYIALSYTGSNLTTAVYKTGGSGGSTVATLTLSYTGSQLDSVTKT